MKSKKKTKGLDISESLAARVLSRLLPSDMSIKFIEDQANQEPDFYIKDLNGIKVGAIEVTTATSDDFNKGVIRTGRTVNCSFLNYGWWLDVENAYDQKWLNSEGCYHLATLEQNSVFDFEKMPHYHSNNEQVSKAITKLTKKGFFYGSICSGVKSGKVKVTLSNKEPIITSTKSVTNMAIDLLCKPDNLEKMSANANIPGYQRHLFIRVDIHAQLQVALTLLEEEPPAPPLSLEGRATHVWIAIEKDSKTVVWLATDNGWQSWCLV